MLLYNEFQRFNPFCEPDWRFARVTQLERDRKRCTRRDDQYIQRMRVFYKRWLALSPADREPLLWQEPALYYAMLIHEEAVSNPHNALILQAKLLAGEDDKAIAQTQGMLPQAVHWYEALFFNVRPRLENWCWVVQQVLAPAAARCAGTLNGVTADSSREFSRSVVNAFLDESLKLFGYFGGPMLLDFMITGFHRGRPVKSADDVDSFFDSNWLTSVKRRSAQAASLFDVKHNGVFDLFRMHARLLELKRSTLSEGETNATMEKHIQAFLGNDPMNPKPASKPLGDSTACPKNCDG